MDNAQKFKTILRRNLGLPLVLAGGLSVIFVVLLMNLLSLNTELSQTARFLKTTVESFKYIVDAETGLRGYIITGDTEFLEPYQNANRNLPALFEDLQRSDAGSADAKSKLREAQDLYSKWRLIADAGIRDRKNQDKTLGQDMRDRKVHMDAIRALFNDAIQITESSRDARTNNITERTRLTVLTLVLSAIFLGGIMAVLARRQLIDLSGTYETALAIQQKQNDLLQIEGWKKTGQTLLAERYLRGDLSYEVLGNQVLKFLSEYLSSLLGAIYTVDPDGLLRQTAQYAFPSNAPPTVRMGHGLLGQAALNLEPVFLKNVPDDYIEISSASGTMKPTNIAILPLLADGKLQGVLELGFREGLQEQQIEFLKLLSEPIGNALRSSAYRYRLQELLQESQTMNEELQTQQEELRVSNEELTERSRALQEAQARLEGQHAELQQTNEQLEEQTQLLERQKENLDARNKLVLEAQSEVEKKAAELEAANRYKSEFMANMSHELRTPLNSTLILAKLLKDNPKGNLTAEQIEFAGTIYSAGNDLLNLINDILDLSKVEAGKLEIRPEKISVWDVLEPLEKYFKPTAAQKNVKLQVRFEGSKDTTLFTDRMRVDQVLRNLVSNAIKFTDQGSVTVLAAVKAGKRIEFSVIDTGIGIKETQKDIIFEAFRQADGTTNRKYGGTGLGLSISRSLAHLLGGEVSLDIKYHEGSRFVFEIPMELTPDEVPAPRKPDPEPVSKEVIHAESDKPVNEKRVFVPDDREHVSSTGARTLLIVEDDPVFAKTVADIAREKNYLCLITDLTSEGFELAKTYAPAAVILDMRLADASGLSLLDRLKMDSKTRHIPVHAISGFNFSSEAMHMGAVGFDIKPSSRESILSILKRLDERNQARVKKVLVVEDDKNQRQSIEKLIQTSGVSIESCGLGKEALQKLQASAYECVILDLSLPDMSGFDLLQQMSKDNSHANPPVIIYTGKALSRAEETQLGRYSRSIIIKGAYSPERLLDEVTLFLHQSENHLSPEKQKILRDARHRERAFDGRTILLVDDDVRNIFALTSALEQKGAKVIVGRNGQEAIERLSEETSIDLVLMDIMMPVMDGYEATRMIRQNPNFKKLPIIAVTAKAMRDDYEKCLEAGANDYLSKPVNLDKLISLMRVWLPKPLGRL